MKGYKIMLKDGISFIRKYKYDLSDTKHKATSSKFGIYAYSEPLVIFYAIMSFCKTKNIQSAELNDYIEIWEVEGETKNVSNDIIIEYQEMQFVKRFSFTDFVKLPFLELETWKREFFEDILKNFA